MAFARLDLPSNSDLMNYEPIMTLPIYALHCVSQPPELEGQWNGPAWHEAPVVTVDRFRHEGSSHRPLTQAKLLYDRNGLYGLFRVRDRFVRCRHIRFQDPVYQDSCVEFFFRPEGAPGYFNFEFNCGGALLASYIIDPTRRGSGFEDYVQLSAEDANAVSIYHSLPNVIEPERKEDTDWRLEFYIPRSLIEKYAGPVNLEAGERWRANFYKCGDQTSHPHWAAWSAVDSLNFHLPDCFGWLNFMPPV